VQLTSTTSEAPALLNTKVSIDSRLIAAPAKKTTRATWQIKNCTTVGAHRLEFPIIIFHKKCEDDDWNKFQICQHSQHKTMSREADSDYSSVASSSESSRDKSPSPKKAKLKKRVTKHDAPLNFRRSTCPAGHLCNEPRCYTSTSNSKIIWDKSKYQKPFIPRPKKVYKKRRSYPRKTLRRQNAEVGPQTYEAFVANPPGCFCQGHAHGEG